MFALLWAWMGCRGLSSATICPVGVSSLCSKCPASLIWASEQMTEKLRLRGAHMSEALGLCVCLLKSEGLIGLLFLHSSS